MDSSGIAVVSTNVMFLEVHKLPLPGSYFVTDRFAKAQLMAAAKPLTVSICHTRAATSGVVSLNNAHPFHIEDTDNNYFREMVGAHNGTLQGWHGKPNAKGYSVDSEWALNHIFHEGMDAFKDFDGAYAFVWWDSKEENMLHMARNDQRPMHIAFLEHGGMAYASEAGMLFWLLERNSLKMVGSILYLAAGYHYKFEAGKCSEFTKELLPVKAVVPVSQTASNHNSQFRNSYNNNYYGTAHWDTTVDKLNALFRPVATVSNLLPSPTTGTTGLRPAVTGNEVLEAKKLHVMNQKGTFMPTSYNKNTGELEGIFESHGMEVEGVMRNAQLWEHKWDTVDFMECQIIGAIDSGMEFVAVLSKPHVSTIPTTEGAAA